MAEELDPIASLAANHISTMQQIASNNIDKTQELSEHASKEFRRFSGLRSTALEKLLTAAGIIQPAEASTDAPD
jgi:signal transduction histidine kinase